MIRKTADRQPRRDRLPDHPVGPRDGDPHDRRALRARPLRTARVRRRRGRAGRVLPRHRRSHRGGPGDPGRRDPSRLRLPLRALHLRARARGRRDRPGRPQRRRDGADGPQGPRPSGRHRGGSRRGPVLRPRRRPRRLRLPRAREGRRRWWWQGDADRPQRERVRRRGRRRPARGELGLRRRHHDHREVRRVGSPHRGPGARRRPRQRGAPLRARLLDPAPSPEGARGGRRRPRSPRSSGPRSPGLRSPWPPRSATRMPAPSSSCSTPPAGRPTSWR